MRKANKIMMMTVSILLCLVLITSSVMSSTLAKYVTQGTAESATARVAKWGVTVEATPDPNLVSMATNASDYDENSVGFEFEGIEIGRGESFPNAMHFHIAGQAEVALEVRIYMNISYTATKADNNSFWVPQDVSGHTQDLYFVPINISLTGRDSNGAAKIPTTALYDLLNEPYARMLCYNTERYMQARLCTLIDVPVKDGTYKNTIAHSNHQIGYVSKTFEPGEKITFHPTINRSITTWNTGSSLAISEGTINKNENINDLYFGIFWPDESVTDAFYSDVFNYNKFEYDAIADYLTQNRNPAYTVSFKVVVEQID